jgi:hypothetical protein
MMVLGYFYFKNKIVTTHVKREEAFKLTDVDEYLMTLVEYFKVYFSEKKNIL